MFTIRKNFISDGKRIFFTQTEALYNIIYNITYMVMYKKYMLYILHIYIFLFPIVYNFDKYNCSPNKLFYII